MASSNEQVVRDYIDALERGDLDAVGSMLADDVVFHMGGKNPMSGEQRGADKAVAMLRGILDRMGGKVEVDLHDMLASDEHVVALVRRNIAGVDARAAVVYHVRDGKITEVWPHEADQYAIDEALGT